MRNLMTMALLVLMLAGCKPKEPEPVVAQDTVVEEDTVMESNNGVEVVNGDTADGMQEVSIEPNRLYSMTDDFHEVRCWYIYTSGVVNLSCLPFSQIANARQ